MRQQLKDAWTEALRSGRYAQNFHGSFRTVNDEFCAIGVAWDVLDPTQWKHICDNSRYNYEWMGGDLQQSEWGQWFKHNDTRPLGLTRDEALAVILLQDNNGKSFPDIADYIDANIPVDADDRELVGAGA